MDSNNREEATGQDNAGPASSSTATTSNANEGTNRRERDEATISFRHFLQPQSDVVPTSTRHRIPRGNIDLVDGAVGLPDFVQDHMVGEPSASESASISTQLNQSESRQDANVVPSSSTASIRHAPNCNSSNPPSSSTHLQSGASLPDFLSDGPMQCATASTSQNTTANEIFITPSASENTNGGMSIESAQLRSGVDNEASNLNLQIEQLHIDQTEKNRRISELEELVLLQQQEIASLQTLLSKFKRSTQTHENQISNSANCSSLAVNGSNDVNVNSGNHNVFEMVESSENLARNLLQELLVLKTVAHEMCGSCTCSNSKKS